MKIKFDKSRAKYSFDSDDKRSDDDITVASADDTTDEFGTPTKDIFTPKDTSSERGTTFLELGITEPPFVEEYKEKFGMWPAIVVKQYCKLPLRYYDRYTKKKKFRMQPIPEGTTLLVTGTEAGKKVPTNILCVYKDGEFVLEPKMIERFFFLSTDSIDPPSKTEDEYESTVPYRASNEKDGIKLKNMMDRRKKEARFTL